MSTTILNIAHQSPFGLLFVNYSLLVGLAGALALIWACFNWNAKDNNNLLPILISLTLTVGGILNVLAEVKQQGRLIYGLIYGWEHWYGSIIKYGVISLPIFAGLLLVTMLPIKLPSVLNKVVKLGMIVIGLFLTMYSGIFMMNEHGIAIWSSPLSPVLTMLSSLFVAFFLYFVTTKKTEDLEISKALGLMTSLITLSILLLFVWWGALFANADIKVAMHYLMHFYSGTLTIILVTLLATLGLFFINAKSQAFAIAQFVMTFIAAYLIRFALLVAGEGVSRSGGGTMLFHIDSHEYFYTGASLIFMLGIFSLLTLVLNYFTANKTEVITNG